MCKKLFLYSFLVLLFFSCKNQNTESIKNVFRYNESKGISTLDPAFAKSQVLIWPTNQLFNGLVQMDNKLKIQPCIAKSWEVIESGTVYRFTLRKDVYFHNHAIFKNEIGRKVTAYDFEYSLNRIIDQETASPGAWIFNNVSKDGIKAINDSILEITLKNPFPAFTGLLTMQYCSVVPKEAIDYYGVDFRNNPIGTGPFMFKLWVEGEKLVLVKNPNYFETDSANNTLPYLDAISISFINDKQSEFLEFLKGNVDFISGLSAANKDELITKNGNLNPKYIEKIKMINQPYLNTEYLGFLLDSSAIKNSSSPILNKKIRMAINYGFDRVKMMKYLRHNIGEPANYGFIPKGLPSFTETQIAYKYDPDKTRILLKEAGYPEGQGLQTITLTTTNDYLDLCEYIQQQLSQFGIKIDINVSTGATFRDMVANSKLEFFRGSWIADYPDAENYLALFYSKNFSPIGPNYTHYSNPKFDLLYELAMLETNDVKRYILYQKMNELLSNDAVVVPLYYDEVIRFVSNNVIGLESNPMNLLILKNVQKSNVNIKQ